MVILFLGDSLSNAKQWVFAMEKYGGAKIIQWDLGSKKKLFRPFIWLFVSVFAKFIFKKYKADLVIGYRTTSYGFIAARSGIRPCVIAAQGENDIWPKTGILGPFKKFIKKYACIRADLIHTWGEHMKVSILEFGVPQSKFIVRPRGIDLSLFVDFKPEREIKNKIKFICTRSLLPEYRHKEILTALHFFKQKGYDFEFNIIGTGYLERSLKELTLELGISNKVNFLGFIENSHLPKLLSDSDVYISIPETEGVSASLFEAMACGCFPIVSNLAANRLFIQNEINGILVKEENIDKLFNDLIFVVNQKNLLAESRRTNKILVKDVANVETNIKMFFEIYNSQIKRK